MSGVGLDRAGGRVGVRVPATTANLGPGYDSLGAAVSLHLVATAVPRGAQRVVTAGEGSGEVATDDTNLVWRALVAFCAHHDTDVPEVSVEVDNAVPLERGLGSSSAAIVAGLGLARRLSGKAVGDLALVELATELEGHPDNVAPALLGGLTCCARDDDGSLVVRRVQPHARLRPVAFVPAQRQATGAARALLAATLPREEVATQAARAAHVVGGLAGAWPVDPRLAGDLLHEPPRLAAMEASGALVAELRAAGVHAWLSGAGPSVAAAVAVADHEALVGLRAAGERHGFAVEALAWDLAGLCDAEVAPASR